MVERAVAGRHHRAGLAEVEPALDRRGGAERDLGLVDGQVARGGHLERMAREVGAAVKRPVGVGGEVAEGRRVGMRLDLEHQRAPASSRRYGGRMQRAGKARGAVRAGDPERAGAPVRALELPERDARAGAAGVQRGAPGRALSSTVPSPRGARPPAMRLATRPAMAPKWRITVGYASNSGLPRTSGRSWASTRKSCRLAPQVRIAARAPPPSSRTRCTGAPSGAVPKRSIGAAGPSGR